MRQSFASAPRGKVHIFVSMSGPAATGSGAVFRALKLIPTPQLVGYKFNLEVLSCEGGG